MEWLVAAARRIAAGRCWTCAWPRPNDRFLDASPAIAERLPLRAFLREQMGRDRMRLEPVRGYAEADALADLKSDSWHCNRCTCMMEQHRESQREQLRSHIWITERRLHLGQPA